jgi:hypothetical protein
LRKKMMVAEWGEEILLPPFLSNTVKPVLASLPSILNPERRRTSFCPCVSILGDVAPLRMRIQETWLRFPINCVGRAVKQGQQLACAARHGEPHLRLVPSMSRPCLDIL